MLRYIVARTHADAWAVGRFLNEITGHILMTMHPGDFHGEKRVWLKIKMGILKVDLFPPFTELYTLLERMPGEKVVVVGNATSYTDDPEWSEWGVIFERDWSHSGPAGYVMTVNIANRPQSVLVQRDQLLNALYEIKETL